MSASTMKKCALMTALSLALIFVGLCIGSYRGYARGYRHGQKVTNAWWIDKQSRYYDSIEMEKKRRSNMLDRI